MQISDNIFHFFLLAFILISGASSAFSNDDFLECLTLQFQKYNSESDSIYTPDNTSYASILQSAIRNLRPVSSTDVLRPVVIITPEHESQIQAAIYCSKKHGIQLIVRSGGHDFEGQSYVSETPFVLLDMRNLRSISIDTDKNTAWVQTGTSLGELYYTIANTSRTLGFPAGVCPTVGVGGQFSGGGYGMMARKHGIAADNIIDAKLIDADGRILDRKSMGEDLFWALRGGGGTSFGVVVAFKLKLAVIPEIVTVFNVTRTLEQNATQLVHRWQYIADKLDDNLLLRLFLGSFNSSVTGKRTVGATFRTLYLGGVDDLLSIVQEKFPELGLEREDCTELSWIESELYFYDLQGQSLDVLLNRTSSSLYSKGKSDYVTQPISEQGLEGIWRFLIEEDAGAAELQFSPYGGRLAEIPESETPFPHRAGNIFMIEYTVVWVERAESERHVNWSRRLHRYMGRYVSKSPRAQYVNYRDLDIGMNNINGSTSYKQASVWGFRYFKNNFRRLVQVKSKVDPTNFFRNEQSIPPLSPW